MLLDVQMPDIDGLEVTRRLRQIEKRDHKFPIGITALTANVLPSERSACLEAGMNDYLTKPLRRDQLAEVLIRTSRVVAENKWNDRD